MCVQESDVAGTFYTTASTPSGEVRCPLPSFNPDDPGTLKLYNWSMSVSNDNATWSDSVQVLVYDPRNVTCHVDGNGTYQCRCLSSENQVKLSKCVHCAICCSIGHYDRSYDRSNDKIANVYAMSPVRGCRRILSKIERRNLCGGSRGSRRWPL